MYIVVNYNIYIYINYQHISKHVMYAYVQPCLGWWSQINDQHIFQGWNILKPATSNLGALILEEQTL